MNILYICDEFPPGKTGGIGSVVNVLSQKLAAQGHRIFIVGLCPHGYGAPDFEDMGNIKVWRLRYKTDIGLISGDYNFKDKVLTHLLRKSGIMAIDARAQLRKMFALIKQLIAIHKIDIIEMSDWNNFYFNARLRDIKVPDFDVPVVVKMHGTFSYFNKEQGLPIVKNMYLKEQSILNRANVLTAVSNYTGNVCRELYKLPAEITTLYNGVVVNNDESVVERIDGKVIFTGSLFYKKGIFSLIKAWSLVLKKRPDARLYVYGKGEQAPLERLMDEQTSRTVFFNGHISRSELLDVLLTGQLAVFPSYSETFGLGVVEAMSMKCPVIYTKRSCGPEIVADNKEGLLVNPDNVEEIAETIIKMLADKPLAGEFSEAAFEKVKRNFNIDKIALAHISFYEDTIVRYKQ